MGNSGSLVKVNVFIDTEKEKVMFAEAQEDFVEIVFSYMTLPLGTIALRTRTSNNPTGSENIKLGSLTSLYQSVLKLPSKHFASLNGRFSLFYPWNSSFALCHKLKVDLHRPYDLNGYNHAKPVFLKNKGGFLITDDLQVVPYSLDNSIVLFKALDVESVDLLEKRTMYFGVTQFSDLLKWSLLTTSPLTNLVLKGRSKPKPQLCIQNSKLGSILNSSSAQPRMIKLIIQKSTKKVICAQVNNFFVELLFSFLTIPLGTVKRLTMDNYYSMGIDNVYKSILRLGEAKYLKSEDVKVILLEPKVSKSYNRVTDFLPIYESTAVRGKFLKKEESFIVSDDLKISLLPRSISEIPKLTLGIPAGDIEIMDLSIGEQEALLILKASLTSTTALTDFLNTFM